MGIKDIQSLPPDWRIQRAAGFMEWFQLKVKGPFLTNDQVVNILEGFEP